MAKDYSEESVAIIHQYLKNNDWNYQFDEEAGVFKFGLTLRNKLRNVKYAIDVYKSGCLIYALCPIYSDPEDMQIINNMARFLCMANYGIRIGNFEMDLRDGEIRYKVFLECEDMDLSETAVEISIHAAAYAFEQYSKGIIQIILNDMTAEEAIRLCEGDSDEEQKTETEEPETESAASEILSFLENMEDAEESDIMDEE